MCYFSNSTHLSFQFDLPKYITSIYYISLAIYELGDSLHWYKRYTINQIYPN